MANKYARCYQIEIKIVDMLCVSWHKIVCKYTINKRIDAENPNCVYVRIGFSCCTVMNVVQMEMLNKLRIKCIYHSYIITEIRTDWEWTCLWRDCCLWPQNSEFHFISYRWNFTRFSMVRWNESTEENHSCWHLIHTDYKNSLAY